MVCLVYILLGLIFIGLGSFLYCIVRVGAKADELEGDLFKEYLKNKDIEP